MFCKKCYARLDGDELASRCPRCHRAYDKSDPRTYLPRPFPSRGKIVAHVAITSIICILAAFVVSFFQMVGTSGH